MKVSARGKVFFAVALGLGVVVAGYAWMRFGVTHRRFTYLTGSLDAGAYAALAAKPAWAESRVDVGGGVTLNGLVRRPASPSAPWVLFYSGNDATPLKTGQIFLEAVRGGQDWGCAVYAYRGYDSSGGTPSRDAIAGDALRIFDALVQREHLDPKSVHVAAFSLGGYFAAHVVGQLAQTGTKVASLSLLASVQDIVMVRRSPLARLALGDVYEIEPLLGAVPAPVLVLQGGADTTLGPEQGRTIAARLGARARYVELPGIDHNPLLEAEAATSAVHAMIEGLSGARQ